MVPAILPTSLGGCVIFHAIKRTVTSGAIRRHPAPSGAIRRHPAPSGAIRRHPAVLDFSVTMSRIPMGKNARPLFLDHRKVSFC